MKQMQIFIVDDILNIVYDGRVISNKLKSCLSKGYIIDKSKFMDDFVAILKKEKIKSKLFGDDIYIIKNAFYSVGDLFFIENIFLELGFLKVYFIDIQDLLPDEEATNIEINETYMVVHLSKGIFLDLNYFKDIPGVLKFFDKDMKDNVYLFGRNKLIPKIKIANKNVYYFEDKEEYIINNLLKVKKHDV